MLIQPDTYIRLIRNCPLDNSYEHTIYWGESDKDRQTNYFKNTLGGVTLTKNSYQRYDKGVLQVQVLADNIYDCNYMMFQNTSFGNKWFYAFITSVEYVNNVTSRITYEIDVMQTWHFEYDLKECFVEREHTRSDEYFENLVEEDLSLGTDYVCNHKDSFDMNDQSIVILADYIKEGENKNLPDDENPGRVIYNIYMPLFVQDGIRVTDVAGDFSIKPYIDQGLTNSVISVHQYPHFLHQVIRNPNGVAKILRTNTTIDGYTPKNKKLFTHPFNFLLVSNNCGTTGVFKWELWDNTAEPTFRITGTILPTAKTLCYPYGYRGLEFDYDSGILYDNFPECPWAGDTYKEWYNQNKASAQTAITTSAISSLGSMGTYAIMGAKVGGAKGAIIGAGVGLIKGLISVGSDVAQLMAKKEDLEHTPAQISGQLNSDALNSLMERIEYSFYSMSIRKEFAKIIDDYFTRFGYAIKENKVPNRNVRPYWTYTKTIGCTITGSVPANDMNAIIQIYNSGITFWKNPSDIGNYSLDNSPA